MPSTAGETVANPYAVIAHAQRQWQLRPGHYDSLEATLAGLLRLGLGGMAKRFFETAKMSSSEWSERIGQAPSGVVPWSSRRRRFQANLAAMAGHDVPDLQATWAAEASRYELNLAADGNAFAFDATAGDPFAAALGGLIDHRAAATAYVLPQSDSQLILPYAFDGAGYGWLLGRVLELTRESYLQYSCPIYLLEPDPVAFCILLHVQDLRPWLSSGRLRLFVGHNATQRFAQASQEHRDWTLPSWLLANRLTGRPAVSINQVVAQTQDRRTQERLHLFTEMNAWYADKSPGYWARRFVDAGVGGPPLKVLGITTRFSTVLQYSMREFGEAVRAAGHEFILSIESDDQSIEQPFLELIHRHKPDLLVTISRMRYENPQLPQNVPALCWDQDGLTCMRTPEATRSMGPLTYVAGHGAHHGFLNLGWPEESCIFFRAAGSTHRYSNSPVAADHFGESCDFSYVSNASGTPESMLAEQLAVGRLQPEFQRFMAETGEEILARCRAGCVWDGYLIDQFVLAQEAAKRIELPPAAHYELVRVLRLVSDRAFRHVALAWVAEYCEKHDKTFRLFGRGWKTHPVFGRFAEEFIMPGEELRAIYQRTKINLQIIESGFIHSRVLDGLAAGGFFMTRLAREARDHNGTGKVIYAMAQRALETHCLTNAQLRDACDPVIQRGWAVMSQTMKPEELRPDMPCRYLRQWAASPTEEVAFSRLVEVTFSDQASFNLLAERYLGDDATRRAMAEEMRKVVIEKFSYDVLWRDSLVTIRRGLEKAAGERG